MRGERMPHIVCDLDDTLYPESDYVDSCFAFVGEIMRTLYGTSDACERLVRLKADRVADPIGSMLHELSLPAAVRDLVVAAMRAHRPAIRLSVGAELLLSTLALSGRSVSIITDGRSVTQRRKLESLGLLGVVQPYISEELGAAKPDPLAFMRVMSDQPTASGYWYIADNPAKDFVSPNKLGWTTVMLKAGSTAIHPQRAPSASHMAQHVVESLEAVCSLPGFHEPE